MTESRAEVFARALALIGTRYTTSPKERTHTVNSAAMACGLQPQELYRHLRKIFLARA